MDMKTIHSQRLGARHSRNNFKWFSTVTNFELFSFSVKSYFSFVRGRETYLGVVHAFTEIWKEISIGRSRMRLSPYI